jgi:ABC-type Na+ efflux pump permease subunit
MNAPVWLIAVREVRTYTSTASFWIALLFGPLLMAGALALARPAPQSDLPVQILADDPGQGAALSRAVLEAGAVEGHRFRIGPAAAGRHVQLVTLDPARFELRIDRDVPLSAAGRMLVLKSFENIEARAEQHLQGAPTTTLSEPPRESGGAGPDGAAHFAVAMILWLTLTGSLGMLLQAVVRERSNRAIEVLLSAARPWEIVFGKLAGVGCVSCFVVFVWLACVAAGAWLIHGATGEASGTLQAMGAPLQLLRSLAIYLAAFAFYGLTTVAVGARARDSSSAQNLSRPMFTILLVAFFITLFSTASGTSHFAWLVYAPPFAPFLLLTQSYSALTQVLALTLLGIAAMIAGWAAIESVGLVANVARPNRRHTD